MARDYCFTVYDKDTLNEFDEDKVKYVIWGREICPDTGRKHLQCYVIFGKKTYRIKGAQKALGVGKCHMEVKHGTREQARDYCKKDGDWEEWGEFDPVTKENLFKADLNYVKDNYPEFYCRYHRGLEKLAFSRDKGPEWRDIKVYWLWGSPGTGKTRKAMEHESVFKADDLTWWDGYEGEERIVLDEYDRETNRKYILNLLDGYRYRLPIKGGFTWAKWTQVYITTNWNPEGYIACMDGLSRRVTSVTRLGVIL